MLFLGPNCSLKENATVMIIIKLPLEKGKEHENSHRNIFGGDKSVPSDKTSVIQRSFCQEPYRFIKQSLEKPNNKHINFGLLKSFTIELNFFPHSDSPTHPFTGNMAKIKRQVMAS